MFWCVHALELKLNTDQNIRADAHTRVEMNVHAERLRRFAFVRTTESGRQEDRHTCSRIVRLSVEHSMSMSICERLRQTGTQVEWCGPAQIEQC